MKPLLAPVWALLLACLLLTACDNDLVNTNKGFVSGTGAVTIVPADQREKPESISGESLTGERISLDD